MTSAVASLNDVSIWARSNLLEIVLYICGAVLLARFVNWFASREGQDVWAKTVREPTLRKDVDLSPVPSYIVSREGVEYPIDEYEYDWFTHRQVEANDVMLALLGR